MCRILVILFASLSLISCNRTEEESSSAVENIQPRNEDVAAIGKILNDAIERERNLPSIPGRTRAHEEALAVFQDFWNPKNIKRYGWDDKYTALYAETKYVLVQRSIEVATRHDETWPREELQFSYRKRNKTKDEWDVETIADFSPVVKIPNAVVISLTKDLSDELLAFLGGDFTRATTPDVMSSAQTREESRMKLVAANKMVRFFPKHWGDGWHLISHPEVEQILFDREYQHALVSFRIVYQGGYAFYDKTPEGWKLTKSAFDWKE